MNPPRIETAPTAIGYCRVSTKAQGEEGVSLEDQRQRVTAYCVARSWSLRDIFMDDASGKDIPGRPGLVALLEEVDARRANIVVVASISRLTRSLRDFVRLLERFEARRVSLVSIGEGIDTTGPVGRMIAAILSVFGQFEREINSERVRAVNNYRRERGQSYSGRAPLGFDRKAGLFVPNAAMEVVKGIFSMAAAGQGPAEIARDLNEAGVPAPGGKGWGRRTIWAITANRIYAREDAVGPDLFERVQTQRKEWGLRQKSAAGRAKKPPRRKKAKSKGGES